jgi:hypothetical protein
MPRANIWSTSGLIALIALPCVAVADNSWRNSPLGKRASLEISAHFVNTDAKVGIKDYDDLGGINVNPEQLLGFDSSDTVPFVSAYWRIAERHTLRYHHTNWNQKNSETVTALGFEITEVKAELDNRQDIISYSYSILFDDSRDFYAGIGIAIVDVAFSLEDTEDLLTPVDAGGSAPIPSFLIGYDWAISDRWIWRNSANVLALSLSLDDDVDYSGTVFALATSIEWRVLSHLSLTAGYEYAYFDVEAHDKGDPFKLTYEDRYHGPRIGFSLQF